MPKKIRIGKRLRKQLEEQEAKKIKKEIDEEIAKNGSFPNECDDCNYIDPSDTPHEVCPNCGCIKSAL